MKKLFFILSVSILTLASCSTSSDPASAIVHTASVDSLLVTVDGTVRTMSATASRQFLGGQTNINILAKDSLGTGRGASFTLTNISDTGTYDIGTAKLNGGILQSISMLYSSDNTTVYSSPVSGTTSVGKLTVTELTTTSIKATFNATLAKQTGTGSVSLTAGSFNTPIK